MKKYLSGYSVFLFILRLFFYFSVIAFIFLHPGISVSFDRIGIMQWFVIVPLMALAAFLAERAVKMRYRYIICTAMLCALSLIAGGSVAGMLQLIAAGFLSYALTFLLFHHPRMQPFEKFARIAALEPFFLAWVCLRLLSLSRSGEDIAGQSIVLTPFILVWTAVVFFMHSAVIYLCLYHGSRRRSWREGLVFFFGALAVMLTMLVVLPPDFVRNAVIENLVTERMPERIRPSDTDRGFPRRGGGRRNIPGGEGGRGELRGLPEHDWPGGGGTGENRQYMVKIVISDREPVYMGDSFRGRLDPVQGFLLSSDEPLNDLARQRFFVTWFDNEQEYDYRRESQDVISLSTLRQKYLPYRPVVIDPVILSENSGPLRYIHQLVSNIHYGDPLLLVHEQTRPFSNFEKSMLAQYLEVPLDDDDMEIFNDYLNNAISEWRENKEAIIRQDSYLRHIFTDIDINDINEFLDTIIALLTSFSQYQYNLNPDDDHSIASIKNFILNSREGDCVEFSNSLALLGRLAGIPSRVVTGFLAAEGLQTPAHIRGLASMRSRIPFLQQFPFDNLFMVTNLHSHSWVQFYIPDFGWLDFEATAFSMPPQDMGDFNNWDVVIPLLDQQRTFSQVRKFPWQAAGRVLLFLFVFALAGAYALRYGREFVLCIMSMRGGRKGARYLYLLLLARLAADGRPVKPVSKTAGEYSEIFGSPENQNENIHFKNFAGIYSELLWRRFENSDEVNERFRLLKKEYRNIIKSTRRRGIHRWFIRIVSLKGLAYL
ncbi:MAG: transglutaminase-like domain-containing protein [Treponema sp.]|nr:transglutaminase-like domain-containing protein [Treponema sp.]